MNGTSSTQNKTVNYPTSYTTRAVPVVQLKSGYPSLNGKDPGLTSCEISAIKANSSGSMGSLSSYTYFIIVIGY